MNPSPLSRIGLLLSAAALSSVLAACSSGDSAQQPQQQGEKRLTLVSYAVTQSAYEKIIPQFVAEWEAKTGEKVVFDQSYGGSGSQARAVIDGLNADVVALALALDTQKIEEAGLIEPGWEQELPNDSIAHKSVVAFVLRDQNINVKTWADLARDDVSLITANPKTSGGARWNFMAFWGVITQAGGSEQQAQDFVQKVYQRVPVLPRDARAASDVFYKQGQGDVLINYENEVILAAQKGDSQPYIVPTDYNISIDNPVAVVDANVDKKGTREVAEAFVQYLYTPQAQREFAKVGFRPVDPQIEAEFADQYPKIQNLFTAKDLGGWDAVQTQFFADGAIFDNIQAQIAQSPRN
ncbi:sulfate ABC transporter substrate-binding protein [Limnoraphis robusta Tam1]|uniref:sulfate ABC transporter substrate-binding protein n=1 Tax=Limnoraphis robusta TaxID=1118279 RepID=UPI002B2008BA|nr:sulfate ABC transporter substrate-binding protein [Limnoraphis robusta]MEA5539639.1 sulfate ABC transporter substrate-binding protein [Limnoraphis robusta Tam1]